MKPTLNSPTLLLSSRLPPRQRSLSQSNKPLSFPQKATNRSFLLGAKNYWMSDKANGEKRDDLLEQFGKRISLKIQKLSDVSREIKASTKDREKQHYQLSMLTPDSGRKSSRRSHRDKTSSNVFTSNKCLPREESPMQFGSKTLLRCRIPGESV